jgi:hypothetical protein
MDNVGRAPQQQKGGYNSNPAGDVGSLAARKIKFRRGEERLSLGRNQKSILRGTEIQ